MISRGWYKRYYLRQIYGDEVVGGGEGGVVDLFFFPGAVHLTIIPQCFFPFTGLSMTCIWFPTQQDTDDLTPTKMALRGCRWSIFNFKQMAADILQAGNTAEPMTSGVHEFEECRWRMLLYVRTKCKLFLQLHRAAHRLRASIRSIISHLDYGLVALAKPCTYKVNL